MATKTKEVKKEVKKVEASVAPKEVFCKAKHLRTSPFKVRRVAKLVRGKNVLYARQVLKRLPHKGAALLAKVLDSAIANATHNFNMNEESLFISTLLVDEASRFKRFQPRARGRVYSIVKRNSHITLGVTSKEGDK